MNKKHLVFLLLFITIAFFSCDEIQVQPQSTSGVKKHNVKVQTNSSGITVEQENIAKRLKRDNQIGSVKHLYLISPMSGQIVLYSTIKGKVTSGGKRLTPKTVGVTDGQYVSNENNGISANIGGRIKRTGEVIQDDGTYGDSMSYLYWFDTNDIYHQIYTGSSIIIIREQPMPVTEISINLNTN